MQCQVFRLISRIFLSNSVSIKCDGRIFNSERRRPTNPDGDWCDLCVWNCLELDLTVGWWLYVFETVRAAICNLWFRLLGNVWTSFCLWLFIYVYVCEYLFNYVLSAASIYSKPCPSYRFNLFSSQPVTFRVSLSLAAGPEAVREDKAGKDDEKEGKSWQLLATHTPRCLYASYCKS